MGEHTKYQMEYIESVDGCAHQSAVDIIGALEQQCDELAEALQEAVGIIDCLVDFVCEGGSIRLIGARDSVREANEFMEGKARAALAKYRQPQEAPELFPGTMEKLRGLGRKG